MFQEIGPFEYEQSGEFSQRTDRLKLKMLIYWIMHFLQDLRRSEFFFYNPELQQNYKLAIVEYMEGQQYQDIMGILETVPIEYLKDHGLTSQQLESKLNLIRFWSVQSYGAVKDPQTNTYRLENERRRKNWGFVTKRLLNMLNSVLGSIAQVIPMAGALKELKDVGENSMDIVMEGYRQNRDINE